MRFSAVRLFALLSLALSTQLAHAAGTLVYCSEGSPEGFDAAQYANLTTSDASAHAVFNRLVEFKPGSTEIQPGLAESWNIDPEGTSITFKLRQGVKFHTTSYFKPSREFNADDVVFTLQRLTDPEFAFNKAYPAQFQNAVSTGVAGNVAAIEKLDDHAVRVNLKSPDADLLAKLAMPWASIQSAEYADSLVRANKAYMLNQAPIGTGPFSFVRYQQDAQIRYRANKDYWNPQAVQIDNLIFAITTDASVRAQKLKANECQVMAYPKPQDLDDLSKTPGIKIEQAPGFNIGYLVYNTEKPQLKDVRVRQALDMAINRKAIIEAVYQGQGQEAANPFPASLWSYDDTLRNAPQDLEKAKTLLADAGYPDGFEISLWAMPVQRPYNPNAKLMAEMIQADWAKIGVKANIVSYEWGEYIKRMKAGEHDTGLIGWNGDYASPDNFLGVLLTCDAIGGGNYARWCNKTFDQEIIEARKTTDVAARTTMYKKAQQLFKQDLPWSTIAHSTVNQPLSDKVEGYKISPFGFHSFSYVSLKP